METPIAIPPNFHPLWTTLRLSGLLWHRTSPAAFAAIVVSGEIVPNVGQFVDTFSQSAVSYARHLGAVSLFDFDSGTENDIVDQECKWGTVLIPGTGASVLVGLRPEKLDAQNVLTVAQIAAGDPRLDTLPAKIRNGRMVIPAVEVLHVGPIFSDAFSKLIFVARIAGGGYRWKMLEPNANSVAAILAENTAWTKAEWQSEQDRSARGEVALEDLVRASFLATESDK